MRILKYEYKQRAFDGKWMLLGLVQDHDNAYQVLNSEGKEITLTPETWVIMNVYDYEMEITDGRY